MFVTLGAGRHVLHTQFDLTRNHSTLPLVEEGETVISSKYCDHVFHKECILEWLDNNDECPCCRVDMVTSKDVSKATATIIGKTRMIMAVESIRVRSSPISPNQRGGISPRTRFGSR